MAAVYPDGTAAGILTPVTAGIVTRLIEGVPVLHHAPEPVLSGTIDVRWTAPTEPSQSW